MSKEIALPSADELEAEEIRRSLYAFIRSAWPLLEPETPFVSNWHIEAICEHLEAAVRGEIRRLLITIPPRHMKSLGVSVFLPAWVWLTHPERRFLYASYAELLSAHHSLLCLRLIGSEGVGERAKGSGRTLIERIGYRGLVELIFGAAAWELAPDQSSRHRFENTRTGARVASSIGGTVTGEGGDVLVLDDPHKPEEAHSDARRKMVTDWYEGTWATRRNDPKRSTEIIVMQRVHEADLAGHLLARGDELDHLCLPAEFEPGHPSAWPRDPRSEPGEVLWRDKWGARWLAEQRARLGSYGYAGQYQQRPAPAEGGILRRAWWRYHDPEFEFPQDVRLCQSWDLAFTANERSDYVVGQLWAQSAANLYLIRQTRARLDFPETLDAIRELSARAAERFPGSQGHAIYVEAAANGEAAISTLRDEIPAVTAVRPKGSKEARAHAVAPRLEAGNVHLPGAAAADGQDYDRARTPGWVQELIEECAAFPNGAHDDQVDALTQALLRLDGGGPTRVKLRGRGGTITGGILDMEF